ncbi:Txe/YoeB family addiction module toxin [Geofilum sp. OHC36d9]|uniref:Txe/YoeB family addiction module toxin n=1 Tax=Geofilum sp. OHC36d9 TaxID=3458413 RepID=UPI004034A24E
MEIEYTLQAKEDIDYWKKSGNASILKKIRKLIEAITQSPFEGIGKPEALKYNLTGCWSRRINKEHRIVYEVFDDKIIVHSLKGHY